MKTIINHHSKQIFLTAFLLLVLVVYHQVATADVLNPKTYTSPSGHFKLFVDPSAMDGSGPATYRFSRDGEVIWSGERPFSLWDAKLTDEGTVAGYAYEKGVDSGGNHGTGFSGLSIIIVSHDGRVLQHDPASSHKAKVSTNFWAGDSPEVQDIVVDTERDRFVTFIPLAGKKAPIIWWIYRLSTGKKIGDIIPDHPETDVNGFQRTIFAEIVPGTPLVLVQWYIYGSPSSAALSLLDSDGKEVWNLKLLGEYDNLGEDWNWYWNLVSTGIQQASVGIRRFSFRSYSLSSRLSFSIQADDKVKSGWQVAKTARVKDHLSVGNTDEAPPELNVIELQLVGTIELKTKAAHERTPIGDFYDFAIDHLGALGFVKQGKNGTTRFIRVDPEGKILSDFILNIPKDDKAEIGNAVPVSDIRWVFVRESYDEKIGTRAWWIDIKTEKVNPIKGFTSGSIESLVPTGDGGFFVLTQHFLKYTIQEEIIRYNRFGKSVWSHRNPGYGQGLSFEAATWIEGTGAAVLTTVTNTIEFFSPDGTHLCSAKVSDMIKVKPNYPTGITADLNGGLILYDFDGSPPIYRINSKGTIIAKFRPRFPDGRTFNITGDVKVAPDGSLWTSDSHSLLKLNAEGVVEKVLGLQPDDNTLEEIRAMTVDSKGRIYAINERTAAVHVFDKNGKSIRTCTPLPTDFATGGGIGSITVDGEGNIYYNPGGTYGLDENSGYLEFSHQCKRIGFQNLNLDSITEEWFFKPGTLERWVLGYESIYLVDAEGKPKRTIRKRPNGNWLENVHDGAVAADGSLAVIASPLGFGWSGGPVVVNIYGSDGEPIKTIPLTEESTFARIAFNGSVIATADNGAIRFYRADGQILGKFKPPSTDDGENYWYLHMSPDGTEIWLRASESLTITRYKLP